MSESSSPSRAFPFTGIRARLVALVLLTALPPIVFFTEYALTAREERIAEARRDLEAVARDAARELESSIRGAQAVLYGLGRAPELRDPRHPDCSRLLAGLLAQAQYYAGLFVADAEGNRACDAETGVPAIDHADREYLEAALATRAPLMGKPVFDRTSGKTLLPFATPLLDAAGQVQGVLVITLDLSRFGQRYVAASSTRVVALWGEDGTVLFRHPDVEGWTGMRAPDAPLIRAVLTASAPVVTEAITPAGGRRIAAVAPLDSVPETGIKISVGIDTDELAGEAQRQFRGTLTTLFVTAGLALAGALLLAERFIRRRVAALTSAAGRIGRGDLTARAGESYGSDELGSLARTFDMMAAAMQRHVAEIERRGEALGESEELFRSAMDHSAIGMALVTPDGRWLRVNQALCRIFGHTEQELLATDIQAIIDPDDLDADREQIRRTLAGEIKTYQIEKRYLRKDGGTVWALLTVSLVRHATGDPRYFIKQVQDITERRRLEGDLRALNASLERQVAKRTSALAAAERLLRDMTNGLPGAVYQFEWPVGEASRLNFISEGVVALTGFPAEVFLQDAMRLIELVVEADRPRVQQTVSEAVRTATYWAAEYRIRRADGRVIWTLGQARPSRLGGRTVWNGYWVDVSARKETEAALERAKEAADAANRAKSAFLAMMSHEIRTPMNAILGMIELLGLSALSDEQRKTLDIVHDSSQSLLQIINDILDFSKIEAGRIAVRPEPASLTDAIEKVVFALADSASRKGLLLETTLDPSVAPVLVFDPLRLRQILFNLVGNAIKFTERGRVETRSTLVADQQGTQRIRIDVEDTGIGISAEDQVHLFKPFVQAESDTTRRFGGTGLGLAISMRLVELMGGALTLESALGQGTTMRLSLELPVGNATSELAAAREATGSGPSPPVAIARSPRGGQRVLVVEDNGTNREMLQRQLAMLGCEADLAGDGEQALRLWQTDDYALVITDCHMPVMDGYTLARRIRTAEADGPTPRRVPIVAYTANAMPEDEEACRAAGMDDFLAKPAGLAALGRILEAWIPADDRAPTDLAAQANGTDPGHESANQAGVEFPIDHERLREMMGGNDVLAREMLLRFRDYLPDEARALNAALGGEDCTAIARTAHRLKGAAAAIGALRLAAVCARIEATARAVERTPLADLQHALVDEIRRLCDYLERT